MMRQTTKSAKEKREARERHLWNEYLVLRDEMKSADTLNYQILGVLVAASSAVLTAGFKETILLSRLCIFLSIYAITFSAHRLLCGNRARIWRISTYIRKFLEPELESINWETRLSIQRQTAQTQMLKDKLSSLVTKNEGLIVSLLNFSTLLAATTSFVPTFIQNRDSLSESLIFTAIFVTFFCLLIYTCQQELCLRRGGSTEAAFIAHWDAVIEHEEALNSKAK